MSQLWHDFGIKIKLHVVWEMRHQMADDDNLGNFISIELFAQLIHKCTFPRRSVFCLN